MKENYYLKKLVNTFGKKLVKLKRDTKLKNGIFWPAK